MSSSKPQTKRQRILQSLNCHVPHSRDNLSFCGELNPTGTRTMPLVPWAHAYDWFGLVVLTACRQSFFTDPNGFDWIGSRTLYISAKCRLALTLTVTKTASNPKRATRPSCWPYWGKHHQSKDHLLKRDMRTVVVSAKVCRTVIL